MSLGARMDEDRYFISGNVVYDAFLEERMSLEYVVGRLNKYEDRINRYIEIAREMEDLA